MDAMRSRWEEAHTLVRFRPRYPNEEVVRWAFRHFDRSTSAAVRILDLGCGAGRHALFLASEGFDVVACDISAAGVEHLEKQAHDKGLGIATRRCAAHDLGWCASDSFDAVLSYGVLCYLSLDEAQQAVSEIRRILKPGGQAFCVIRSDEDGRRKHATEVRPSTWRIDALGPEAPSDMEAGMHMLLLSRGSVEVLFSGFSDVQIHQMTFIRGDFRDDDWLVYARKPV